jgi:hypothetical protein
MGNHLEDHLEVVGERVEHLHPKGALHLVDPALALLV